MADRPCSTVALIFQYTTAGGDKRTDKGGKATLFKRGNRTFLLTVKQVATYAELASTDTLNAVSYPLLRSVRGEKKLTYKNVLKDKEVPEWKQVDVSDEEPVIVLDEETGRSIDLRLHDSIYYLEVTNEAWVDSPLYKPLTESTINVCVGDNVKFCTQRKLGTGFLAEFPQWRSIREIEGQTSFYPGAQWHTVNSPYQVPPTTAKDCKSASISFAFPSSILSDSCYYPPMFLIDVNIKSAACGWPVINEQNELIGLVSEPIYVVPGSKDLCKPGTWVCAVPADLNFPEAEGSNTASQESTGATPVEQAPSEDNFLAELNKPDKPKKKNKPKKKTNNKKKGKK